MIYSLKYTNDMEENQGGYAKAWFIRIRPRYKDDVGIHRHEETHVEQWWRTLGLHSLLYLISKRYRLWAEVQAYRVQLQNPPADQKEEYRKLYAKSISENYGLNITQDEVEKLLE